MSDFVDSMNLVNDEEEEMAMDDTFSPVLHTIEGAIKYRAIHPDREVPPKPEAFLAYSRQSEELQERSKDSLKRLIKAADVKKVPPKVKGRKRYRDVEKPISGLDVEELFRKEKRTKISSDNSIPEFKQRVEVTDNIEDWKDAIKQMKDIIEEQIRSSFGSQNYDRAVEGLRVMRTEVVGMEEPKLYNDVLREIKKKVVAGQLGGDRSEFWWVVKKTEPKLGPIDTTESTLSDVSPEEAVKLMATK